jgi:DmsE family decaheme c-type cytochrome
LDEASPSPAHALRRPGRRVRTLAWLAGAVVLLGPAFANAAPSDYVGDETCAACHQKVLGPYHQTLHAKVLGAGAAPGTEMVHGGCESCHGPGRAHAEAGGAPGKGGPDWISFSSDAGEDPERLNAACLSCHEGGRRIYWEGSPHDQRRVTCVSCHYVMRNVSERHLLERHNQVETCSQCHLLPRSQIWRNSHMPLREGPGTRDLGAEGWMSCTACHNPHGTVTPKLIDAVSVNDKCYSCHADKRGPFLWEHAPVVESCLNCHSPHGSVNPYMLTVAPLRLCQNCHIETRHPTDPRDPLSRFVIGQSCLNCHPKVHGSNHPSGVRFNR